MPWPLSTAPLSASSLRNTCHMETHHSKVLLAAANMGIQPGIDLQHAPDGVCVCKCVCVCVFLIGCTRSTPTETLPSPVQIQPIPRLCPLSGHLLCQYITLCNGQLHRKVPIVYIALHLIQDQLAYSSDSGWIRKTAMRERVRERQRDREREK